MALNAGTRVGSYEIRSLLGAGGMGEVYRARDSKLGRDVAIKVLHFTTDPERLARFEREARMLASLNHRHIGTIYGVEETDDGVALILELIEGDTLFERLRAGPLPIRQALAIARQIAEALDATHERGIVHRDLKPSNIKISPSGEVKVLDFGLAKLSHHDVDDNATTTAHDVTSEGTIVGTAAYMSPEQVRGQQVDKRTDIWAFGCVLFEMLAGQPPFYRATFPDVAAAIIADDPDWATLPHDTPASTRRLIESCLQKEPTRRLRDIGDASFFESLSSPPVERAPRWWRTAAIALICVAITIAAAWTLTRRSRTNAPDASVSRSLIDVRPASGLLGANAIERIDGARWRPSRTALALSPDGRMLAFTAHRDGVVHLYLRSLQASEATVVAATDGADGPFFSPDGQAVAFWSRGALWRIAIAGGPPVKIADAPQPSGAMWTGDGSIVYALPAGIMRVPASGGVPEVLVDSRRGNEPRLSTPHVLPGGKSLLLTELPNLHDWANSRVVAYDVATKSRKPLLEGAADARYTASGHLVYMRLGNLMAAPFDVDRVALAGAEVGLVEGVMQSVGTVAIPLDTGAGQFTVSSTGTLAYIAGDLNPDFNGTLQWIGRDGAVDPIVVPPPARPFFSPRLSPDGTRLAITTLGLRDHALWRYTFLDRTLTRLTSEGTTEHPVWSRDGNQIAFALSLNGPYNVFRMRADGSASAERVTRAPRIQFPGGWSPDAQHLVFNDGGDLAVADLRATPSVTPLVATRFNERMVDVSPDGRWIAFVSNETGRSEVYVQSVGVGNAKRLISTDGGQEPAWSANGRKLTYLSPAQRPAGDVYRLIEVDVAVGDEFAVGPARTLFELPVAHYAGAIGARGYDLTAGAERFLFVHETYPPAVTKPREMHLVQNWFQELRQRVR